MLSACKEAAALKECSLDQVLALIAGKWKVTVMYNLLSGPRQFGVLQRAVTGISHKVLTQHLRQMERDGLVTRSEVGGNPPGVEYALSPLAESLRPLLEELDAWGRDHLGPSTA